MSINVLTLTLTPGVGVGRNFGFAIRGWEGASVPDFRPEGLTVWPPITLTNAQTHPDGHLYGIAGTLYTLRY